MLTAALALAAVLLLLLLGLARTAGRPDPIDHAYNTLPAGRPELRIDTTTGSHDHYPHMTDNTRDIVTAYCDGMWYQPATNNRNN